MAIYVLERFYYYTHRRKVNVSTYHGPLVSICQKPRAKAHRRLQNLLQCSQQYDFLIRYKPGKEIPLANAFSRAPTDKPEAEELMIVNNLTMHLLKNRRLLEIRSKILEETSWGYCYRLAQGQKTIATFLKTVRRLQGRVDSTRCPDTKRTENSYPHLLWDQK